VSVRVYSFSSRFAAGLNLDSDAIVYDVRGLPNPFGYPALRNLNGTHPRVRMFVENAPGFPALIGPIVEGLADGQAHAFFCIGGMHRSVACAEAVADACDKAGLEYDLTHMRLNLTRTNRKGGLHIGV
jgi:UPF0042 nucleotide-binding protein